ncbi:MAG TPA: electron transporter RnfG, partial [Clostridiales bacterium]|nr:electron transporter RnfG [Clostridiales bacterium]
MSETVRIGFKLFLITAIATLALAWTHMITGEPIRAQVEKTATESRQAVLPE